MSTVLAIDPGANGGIAVFSKVVTVFKMPETPADLLRMLKNFKRVDNNCVCVMEKLHGMPHMGGVAMFKFGTGYGHLEMALLATEIPTETVTPQKWQKFFQLGTKKDAGTPSAWKNKLKTKAQQLYPKLTIHLWASDALLIGHYAKQAMNL